jgi:DNA repair/transcription protein MET18/MMS19
LRRNEALKTLSAISALTTRPIEEHTLPLLFDQLPGEAPALSDEKSRYYIRQVLESLATLCVQPGLFEALHLRLVRQFAGLCEGSTSTDNENMDVEEDAIRRECQVAFAYSLLHAIRTTLQRKIALKHHDIAKHYEHLVPRLYSIFIDGVGTDRSIANDPRLMAEGAAVVMIMTQTLANE